MNTSSILLEHTSAEAGIWTSLGDAAEGRMRACMMMNGILGYPSVDRQEDSSDCSRGCGASSRSLWQSLESG